MVVGTITADVSLIVALHQEGKYLRRTLSSIREAAVYASLFGIRTELIATLDQSDDLTREILHAFDVSAFTSFQELQLDYGSLGASRNAGIATANGKYVCTCDGDDLLSYNTIAAMFRDSEQNGPLSVLFPQYLFGFGYDYHVIEYLPLGDITTFALTHAHPFNSRVFAHRDLFSSLKYDNIPLSDGYAYEDWHFNCELTALGYSIDITKDTILFYRKRGNSLLDQAQLRSVGHIPPSALFNPRMYASNTLNSYQLFRDSSDSRGGLRTEGASILTRPVCLDLIAAANRIEPAIDPARAKTVITRTNATWYNINTGIVYHEICTSIDNEIFDDLFLFPFFGHFGIESYYLAILGVLQQGKAGANVLVVHDDDPNETAWIGRLPPNVTVINLASYGRPLAEESKHTIALKLIQSCARLARIHINDSAFSSTFFHKFRSVLSHHFCIFYRFDDVHEFVDCYEIVSGTAFEFLSDNLEYFSVIISPNSNTVNSDTARIGAHTEKWQYVPPPIAEQASSIEIACLSSGGNVLLVSLLPPSRTRALLSAISERLSVDRPEVKIHLYECDVSKLMTAEDHPNVFYAGPFPPLIGEMSYSAALCVGLDGQLPFVVLEAMKRGWPVIAPDISALADLVIDGETGVLFPSSIDDGEMAAGCVAAVSRLLDNSGYCIHLTELAFDHLSRKHSYSLFRRRLVEVLNLDLVASSAPTR